MRVSARGQVTIPLRLREKLGILPGTEVEFVEENGHLYLREFPPAERGTALVRKMAGKGNVKISTDKIMTRTRNFLP